MRGRKKKGQAKLSSPLENPRHVLKLLSDLFKKKPKKAVPRIWLL